MEFYSSRDRDYTPNLRIKSEDYGANGLI
jgi:hypothetical protein